MVCQEVFKKIEELNEKYIDVWEAMCLIESPTANKAAVDAVGAYIADWAQYHGFKVELERMENAGDPLCITMNPDADGAPVVMSGHIDTVHPIGLFGTPAVRRDEKYLYGPGAVDCKGGVVSAMLVMEALKQCGFTARPVKLVVQTDEETSSKNSGKRTIEFMVEKSRGAAAFLNGEGCTGKFTLSRKGIVRYRLTVHGKAAHSAKCTEGINAVTEAAHKIIKLEEMKDIAGLTCNCGVIQGGTVANSVAEYCSFLVDIRFANDEQFGEAETTVRTVAETAYLAGTTCEIEVVSQRPAMELTEVNLALYNRINEILAAEGMETVEYQHAMGGADSAYTTIAGIPTIDSIGVDGEGIHSIREKGLLSSLVLSAKRQAAIIMNL